MATPAHDWLNGDRDYTQGVQILRDHEASTFIIDMLAKGPDHYNTPRLLIEIEKIIAAAPQVSAMNDHGTVPQLNAMADLASTASHNEAMGAVSDLAWQVDDIESTVSDLASQIEAMQAATGNPSPESGNYVPDHDLEKKLRYDAKIKQLFKEMAHLHGQLDILSEGDQLQAVAAELMHKKLRKQDLWDHLHYYNTHGVWFDDLPENQPKPEDSEQEIKNLMSNRSKAAAKLLKPQTAAKKQFFQDKIASINIQIENLKKLRNNG